jgi:hypothetical protein
MWTVVPTLISVITAAHIHASIFNRTYLRWYWRYINNSMRLVLQTLCQILQIKLCELWSRPYTVQLQLNIFMLQYSTERICADIGDISTIQCPLYCKRCAKYSAHPPDYAAWTAVPALISVITAAHIHASIFNRTYLRWYWRYIDNSMRLVLPTLCQIQRTSSRLSYVNCGPGHI